MCMIHHFASSVSNGLHQNKFELEISARDAMMNSSYTFRHHSHSWLPCSCRLNPILSTEVVFCTQVPSIKTKVAHSRNKMYYFMFMVCDILTFICTWSKLWVNAFTLYVAFQYYCIASIYCNANSHWLGSTKGCPSSYSHVGYFDLFIENKVGDFFLIYFTIITKHIKFS